MEDLMEIIRQGINERLELKLKENPSIATMKTDKGVSLLQYAAYCRNQEAVRLLKKYKQNIDIYEAVIIGDIESVKSQMENQPEYLNSFSSDGFTLLGFASFFGHLPIVNLLLKLGANPNIASKNPLKVAPIHSACAISDIDIAKLLIEFGADVNTKQIQGVTPLHSAAHNGHTNLTILLLENGADVNAKMDDGKTPLMMANEKNFNETAEILRKYGSL
ncbi:MAG TPA: ankyrin repeat domain-containing protein [Saprospiraceae bacterium]|nr:ankyrin repeat domain-containing protein [Saprospiraceae bacterium]